MIHFPKLGLTIKNDTPKQEVERLRAKYPEVARALTAREKKQTATSIKTEKPS